MRGAWDTLEIQLWDIQSYCIVEWIALLLVTVGVYVTAGCCIGVGMGTENYINWPTGDQVADREEHGVGNTKGWVSFND